VVGPLACQKTSRELRVLVTSGKVRADLPSSMDNTHQRKLDKLKEVEGADFDKAFGPEPHRPEDLDASDRSRGTRYGGHVPPLSTGGTHSALVEPTRERLLEMRRVLQISRL
jgi:putative membrane protein